MNETQAQQVQANMVQVQQIQGIIATIGAIAFIVYMGVEVLKVIMPQLMAPKGKD